MSNITIVQLNELDAQDFILFQKYYQQFRKLREVGVLEKGFTGQVILDVMFGEIKNLKRVDTWHY